MLKKINLSAVQIIPLGFFLIILCGALFLMLPISSATRTGTSFLNALFTSTTSVCVTGGVVVPTYSYWSLFGKIIILILIQLGGLGIIAVNMIIVVITKKKISVRNLILLRDSYDLNSLSNVSVFFRDVIVGTLLVEALGAVTYAIRFVPKYGVIKGIWYSVFTAISAFCNAGIDILGPDSLMEYKSDYLILVTTMALIILGGLGYVVWFDLRDSVMMKLKKRNSLVKFKKRLGEHTKLVIIITGGLIVLGALCIFIMEYSNPDTIGNMSLSDKIVNSIFQSVTFRTAGFVTIPQSGLRECSAAFGDVLMFIGGSPVGTAGGVKTITVFILLLNLVSFVRDRNEIVVFSKKVSRDFLRKASAIFMLNLALAIIFTILLSAIDGINIVDSSYEVVSSISTVGLSRDVTGILSAPGKSMIIIAMFLGRIGPISMALLLNKKHSQKNHVSYAEGKFFVG